MARKQITAMILISLAVLSALSTASASSTPLSDLESLVSSFDDPRMDAVDLAFYLATHGIDATPEGDHAEVELDGDIYKLTPNGAAPGLASITS